MEDVKCLFDQTFIDSLPELRNFSNPGVVMLCRHLHPFRAKVEEWFTHLPESEKKDTRARLRSTQESLFAPAMFELYLHEYCLMNGWKPKRNPVVNGLTPDLLVESERFGSFYLEAANVFQPPDMLGQQREVNFLLDKLNEIQLPFTASLVLEGWPKVQVKPAQIARKVQQKLNLALKEGRAEKVKIDLSEFQLEGTLRAHFDSSATNLAVLYTPPLGVGLASKPTMNRALERKAFKYKNLEKPYVISICTTDVFPLNDQTVECALYGDIKYAVNLQTEAAQSVRAGGLFPPRTSDLRVSNANVSAVLYAEIESVEQEWLYTLRVYHNPWAKHPLSSAVFECVPQFVGKENRGGVEMSWIKEPKRAWKPLFS